MAISGAARRCSGISKLYHTIKADEVVLTHGAAGANHHVFCSLISAGDRVVSIMPTYQQLYSIPEAIGADVAIMHLKQENDYLPDLNELRSLVTPETKMICINNPNNPTGVIFSEEETREIARLAKKYHVILLVDQLYSRQIFDNHPYTHLRALPEADRPDSLLTIMGPSKTESLSGFRLGTAFGSSWIIDRMEKLQAIVTLRAPGYSQYVFRNWFREPEGWLKDRIAVHQAIRDDLIALVRSHAGCSVRKTEGGSYIFPTLPPMDVSISDFAKIVRKLTGVIITPGTEFGPQFTHSFRVNFSQDPQNTHDAIDRVLQIMERYRSR